MGKLCIFEDRAEGHRLVYIAYLIEHLFRVTGKKILLLTTDAVLHSEEYSISLKSLEEHFDSVVGGAKAARGSLQRYRMLTNLVKKCGQGDVDLLLVPSSDGLTQISGLLALMRLDPLSGLNVRWGLLRLGVTYPGQSALRKIKLQGSFWLQQKSAGTRLYYDSYAVASYKVMTGIELNYVPDPLLSADSNQAVPPASGAAKAGLRFGCIGHLSGRKGVDLAVDAFVKADLPGTAALCLAGKCVDKRVLKSIESARKILGPRLEFRNGILNNSEYWEVLNTLDVVCLPYPGHVGPSGIFAQAASIGKLIITTDFGWLGSEARKYNKALTFKNDSVEDLCRAMEKAEASADALRDAEGNYIPESPENFVRILSGY